MEIKAAKQKSLPCQKVKNFARSKRKVKWAVFLVIGVLVLLCVALSGTYYGMVLYRTGEGDDFIELLKYGLDARLDIVPNFFKGLAANPERIFIDVKQADFQKLAYQRAQALEKGELFASPDDFVPADIRHNNETIRVRLRLKGDNRDHWKNITKWSFRVEVKGDNALFGMKDFSLQHPRTRSYLNEWFFHKMLEYNGLIHLRYDFIDVTLQGKHLGIYALEEHFEKRLVENNEYREGPIIRFDAYLPTGQNYPIEDDEAYALGIIDAFQTNKIKKDENLSKQFNQARNLLESFKRGTLMTHQVFDVDKMAKIFALTGLFGQFHSIAPSNIRFYYNPVTSLLEPIGYDNQIITPITGALQGEHRQIQLSLLDQDQGLNYEDTFFKDKEFFKKYIQTLEAISSKEFLDQFFAATEKESKEKLALLYKSFPGYKFEAKDILYQNQEFIRNVLNPDLALQAYYKDFSDYNKVLELDLGNMQVWPIEIVGLGYKNNILKPLGETILQSKKALTPIEFQTIAFLMPPELQFEKAVIEDLKLHYKILGLETVRTEPIFSWSYLDADFRERDFLRQAPNWQQFPFLETNWQTKVIYIKPGEWELNKNLIIPEDFTVVAEGGVHLNLFNSAKILSYSPLQFSGTEDNPIIIESPDSTGQGIVVIGAEEKSILKSVFFKNLSAPSEGDWELTGAVNFYEAPVEIFNCGFENNHSSDDYLNIIRSEFIIEDSLFKNTFADAIDFDFSKGRISSTSFIDCGIFNGNGDCIDFSGSVVELKEIFIAGAGDKGLSVGENSYVLGEQIEIKNATIAAVSKDMSTLKIQGLSIFDSKTGLACFQKKSEFGPAALIIEHFDQKNVQESYILEEGSSLIIDNTSLKPNAKDVATTLYPE